MSDPSSPATPRDTPWLRWQLAVAGLIAVASAFFLAAATTLRLRNGVGGSGFPANLVRRTLELFGFESTFMVAALLMVWCSVWFFTGRFDRPVSRLLRIAGLGFCLAVLVGLRADGSAGGEVGEAIAARLAAVLSPSLVGVLVGIAVVAALLLATDFFFFGHFKRLAEYAATGAAPKPVEDRAASEPGSSPAATIAAADSTSRGGSEGVEAAAVAELEQLRLAVHEIEPRESIAASASAAGVPHTADAGSAALEVGDVVEPKPTPVVHRRRESRRSPRATTARSDAVPDESVLTQPSAAESTTTDDAASEATSVGAEQGTREDGGDASAAQPAGEPDGEPDLHTVPLPTPGGWFGAVHVESLAPVDAASGAGSGRQPDHAERWVDERHPAHGSGLADHQGASLREPDDDGDHDAAADLVAKDELIDDEDVVADVDLDTEADPDPEEHIDTEEDPDGEQDLEEFDFEIPRSLLRPVRAADDLPVSDADLAPDAGLGAEHDDPSADLPAESGGPGEDEPQVALKPAPRVPAPRQDSLFGAAGADERLLAEARDLVVQFRRASATFLKRRLRVSDREALELMQELARRGVIECDDDAAHGRVLVDR